MDAHGTLMGIGGRLLSDTLRLSIHKRSSAVSLFLLSFAFGPARADTPIREGDHIAIVGNTYADQLRIHGYLETLLLQRSSGKPVSIRNLGWAGDMLHARDRPTNFPSEESTLTAHKTDVIIACFGMGESFAGHEGLADFRKSLEAWLASHRGKKYNGTSEVRTILVSPIASENLGEHTPNSEKRNRILGDYMQAMGEVASQNQIPFVNLFDRTRYLMNDPAGPKMTVNGIRLNAYGFRVKDVPRRAIYLEGERQSQIKGLPSAIKGSYMLARGFFWRLLTRYLYRDFHPLFCFYLLGLLLVPLGLGLGCCLLYQQWAGIGVSGPRSVLCALMLLMLHMRHDATTTNV